MSDAVFLREAARYFRSRPTGGEDRAHWSNVYNANNCERIANRLEQCIDGSQVPPGFAWSLNVDGNQCQALIFEDGEGVVGRGDAETPNLAFDAAIGDLSERQLAPRGRR